MSFDNIIRKHAIKNAHDYGRADGKAIVGKVIAEAPDAKKDMKGLMESIGRICEDVNALSKEEVEKEYASYGITEEKRVEKREWRIEGAEQGKVVTRFSPEPNGYIHIGHVKTLIINKKVAEAYNGRFYLKFDDTNPETCRQEYVDAIRKDIEWLGIKPDKVLFVSDVMDKLINTCEGMLKNGHAYVCTCAQEEIKRKRAIGEECACRSRSVEENLSLWERMKTTMKEGEAVVRFKGDMKALNTVMRDPALYRVLEHPHYKIGNKYRVYPTYDFENPISDAIFGINTVLRSKEFELRAELHHALLKAAGLPDILCYEYARVAIDGYPVSKRLIRPHVESGFFMGYDDPRLVTIAGLRRRGIPPKAIEEFSLSFGLSKLEVNTDLKKLIAETRKYYEPIARHYYAVAAPKKLIIDGGDSGVMSIKLHPSAEMGVRAMPYSGEIFISGSDFDELHELELIRLKDFKNVNVIKIDREKGIANCRVSISQDVIKESKKLQWVDAKTGIKCVLWFVEKPFDGEKKNENSLREVEGVCEAAANKIEIGEVVQFERIGFFILDDKEKMRLIKTD